MIFFQSFNVVCAFKSVFVCFFKGGGGGGISYIPYPKSAILSIHCSKWKSRIPHFHMSYICFASNITFILKFCAKWTKVSVNNFITALSDLTVDTFIGRYECSYFPFPYNSINIAVHFFPFDSLFSILYWYNIWF